MTPSSGLTTSMIFRALESRCLVPVFLYAKETQTGLFRTNEIIQSVSTCAGVHSNLVCPFVSPLNEPYPSTSCTACITLLRCGISVKPPMLSNHTQPRCYRHGLSVQHVRAVGIQIQAKVRETGHQVDVNGSCWASQAEINHPAVGEQLQHDFCNRARGHYDQPEPGQEDEQEDGEGQNNRVWRRNYRGGDDANNGGPRRACPSTTTVANSVNEDWRGHEHRQRSGGGRRRNRRRRSWQGYYSTDEDDQYWSSSASGEHAQEEVSLARNRRSSEEEHSLDSHEEPPTPPPPPPKPPGDTST